jgi:uncharacterized protein (DUF1810 family)
VSDPYNLQRFIDAQEKVLDAVRSELRAGRKTSHWMWFVFPQIEGLGHSAVAKHFALSSRQEAQAYLNHPLLRARLIECVRLLLSVEGRTIGDILGHPDDLKFRSSMTLFARVARDTTIFQDALDKYFAGEPDPRTIERL